MAARAPASCLLRPAASHDLECLVAFTLQEALDAEGVTLRAADVRRGVSAALSDPGLARYWVAQAPDGRVVASISVVTEWSNFHGGHYWWVQSLFVVGDRRGQGVVDQLLDYVAGLAAAAGALDLRLYAHHSNARAIHAYERCGFSAAPYVLMRRRVLRLPEPP
jgi:ribosomal protein S18 acetylase RimI-like enzyme